MRIRSILLPGPIAGVARAAVVVAASSLAMFNIPEAGLLLILGVEQILDMGRTATNVVGNSVATAVIAKFEPEEDEVEKPLSPQLSTAPNERAVSIS